MAKNVHVLLYTPISIFEENLSDIVLTETDSDKVLKHASSLKCAQSTDSANQMSEIIPTLKTF